MKIIMAVKKFADFPVGIIGGSDGPTAVFVTSKPSFWILASSVIAAAGAALFCCLKRRKG